MTGRIERKHVVAESMVTGPCHDEGAQVRGQVQRFINGSEGCVVSRQTHPTHIDDIRPIGSSIKNACVTKANKLTFRASRIYMH